MTIITKFSPNQVFKIKLHIKQAVIRLMGYVSKCPHSQTHAWGLDSEPRSLVPACALPCINSSPALTPPISVHSGPCTFTSDQREAAVLICQKLYQICPN